MSNFYFIAAFIFSFCLGFLVGVNINVFVEHKKRCKKDDTLKYNGNLKDREDLKNMYSDLSDITGDFHKKLDEINDL